MTERCRTAEMMPTERPNVSQTTTPPIVSEIVAGRFCLICSSTSTLRDVALAEVLVGEDVPDVVPELDVQRVVEAEVAADLRDHLGRRLAPGAQQRGIGRPGRR